ncbi:BspA family leucine-rich repeat surface protein [Pseudopedobacter beijingensis]|uniref:BspA family leucine-rich repeat surface protein n=1 Tax=Pseudopedobacter beijingensis TaxID=1207056 RepID=A0ABW4I7P7_9SPHI
MKLKHLPFWGLLVLLCLKLSASAQQPIVPGSTDNFVTTWKVTAEDTKITIPTVGLSYNYDVYWVSIADPNVFGLLAGLNSSEVIDFGAEGTYRVEISGDFPRFYLGNNDDRLKLYSIVQWGNIEWESMESAFRGAENMVYEATDKPNLSQVTDMSFMFDNARAFNGTIGDWDVSNVKKMKQTFTNAISFNQDLGWTVSNVTDMGLMFWGATAFNGNISNWTVSGVTDMISMFFGATNFNQDLNWDVSNVKNMSMMFSGAVKFNGNIASWVVSSVESMESMFYEARAFNGNIGSWDVSKVTDMSSMFREAVNFNQNLNWTVSNVKKMHYMFHDASSFNGDITGWDVSAVDNMEAMFWGAKAFNGNIGNWTVSNVINMKHMFHDAEVFNHDLHWNVSKVEDMSWMFANAKVFNGNINNWIAPNVNNMSYMFRGAEMFEGDISDWEVLNVTDMQNMFFKASRFNGNIGDWIVSKVENMAYMFREAAAFNRDLRWDVSKVTRMAYMFYSASAFNGNISGWVPSSLESMENMFKYASSFNSDIGGWDVSKVGNMNSAFNEATAFNQSLRNWKIASVTNMANMLDNSGLSRENYDATLTGWNTYNESLSSPITGITLGAKGLKYCKSASARENLMTNRQWNIQEDLEECPRRFITTWTVQAGDTEITIPTSSTYAYNYDVYWESTSDPNVKGSFEGVTANQVIDFGVAGTYRVEIGGDFPHFYLNNHSDYGSKLQSIDQWGDIQWKSMNSAFKGANEMEYNATDLPDLSQVTDLSYMFFGAKSFNGEIGSWDVSNVKDMSYMFSWCDYFNQDINNWNVSKVENMSYMFDRAARFTKDLNKWNVSKVKNMSFMFYRAFLFNGEIGSWDVSNVENMNGMFSNAPLFNKDIGGWVVSNVQNMKEMFDHAALFNKNVGNWKVSNVEDMSGMFHYATVFNQNLNKWDVAKVKDMRDMFAFARAFNGDIEDWEVSGVKNMGSMFSSARSFNGDLSKWASKVSNVTEMGSMFFGASIFNGDVSRWEVGNVTDMSFMFSGTQLFNRDLSYWNVSKVVLMQAMFSDTRVFNGNIDNWDVSKVVDMRWMFSYAESFNRNIGQWTVSNVVSMLEMFKEAASFNYSLGNWKIESVNNMFRMLDGSGLSKENYDATLIGWNTYNESLSSPITGITLGAKGLKYCMSASARENLKINRQWNIQEDLEECPRRFITTWTVQAGDTEITIPTSSTYAYNYDVYWESTSDPNVKGELKGVTGNQVIDFGAVGTYRVEIGGDFPHFYMDNNAINAPKLHSIDQWGDIEWKSMSDAFAGAVNMEYNATDVPDLSQVTAMDGMFQAALKFNGDIGAWDVSHVKNMRHTFSYAAVFNADINDWDVSNVEDMRYLFYGTAFNRNLTNWKVFNVNNMERMFAATSDFNGNISNWDVSNVKDMRAMFDGAVKFNGNISNWKVFNVTDMTLMFANAALFNQDIGNWNVSGVKNMQNMFSSASSFNKDLRWDVSKVENMSGMFSMASQFNGDISSWDVSNVKDMSYMFSWCDYFNQDIGGWAVSAVKNMSRMFQNTTSFNKNIGNWDVAAVNDMNGMFWGATAFNHTLGNWKITSIVKMENMLDDSGLSKENYDATLTGWNTYNESLSSPITGITLGAKGLKYCMSASARENLKTNRQWNIQEDLEECPRRFITTWTVPANDTEITISTNNVPHLDPNISSYTYNYNVYWESTTDPNVNGLLGGLTSSQTIDFGSAGTYRVEIGGDFPHFYLNNNQNSRSKLKSIDQWGDIQWESMKSAFHGAENMVYAATDKPDLSKVKEMDSMFEGAIEFNGNIGNWDVSNVTSMSSVFQRATKFNQNLNDWKVHNVQNMRMMFSSATAFNGDISSWNVSSVMRMDNMFSEATQFNQNLNDWKVHNVSLMSMMFYKAKAFNGNISSWDVSGVTNMSGMFMDATKFNQDIGGWTVSAVEDMSLMLYGAASFNKNIGNWDVAAVNDMNAMFWGATAFNHTLGNWKIASRVNMDNMLNNSGLSKGNYDATLIGWNTYNESLPTPVTGIILGARGLKYCRSGADRDNLMTKRSWNIQGDQEECSVLTVVADPGQGKVYGNDEPSVYTYTVTGFDTGDDEQIMQGALTRVQGEQVGAYNILQGTLSAPYYTINFQSSQFNITKAQLTVTANAGQQKVYGQPNPSVYTYAVSGLTHSDTEGGVLTGSLSRVQGESVGDYTITEGSLQLTTLGSQNYTLSFLSDKFKITQAQLTVTADAGQQKVYGQPNPLPYTYTVSGLVYGDTEASVLTGSLSRDAGEVVGNYNIIQNTLKLTTQGNSNYTLDFKTDQFKITPAKLTVIVNAGQQKVYGKPDPLVYTYMVYGLTNDDIQGGVLTGSLSRNVGEAVGDYDIIQNTLKLTTQDGSNYTLDFISDKFKITQALLIVTANAGQQKVYGESNPSVYTYTVNGLTHGDTEEIILTGTLSRTSGEAVGEYDITQNTLKLTSQGAKNYMLSFRSDQFKITPATLTVTANAGQQKVYGQSNPSVYTYTVNGLANGDTEASVLTGSLSRVSGELVGEYPITQGSLSLISSSNRNYILSFQSDKFKITQAQLTVTANVGQYKVYGEANPPAYTYTVNGLTNDDIQGGVLTGSLSRVSGEVVGDYPITQGSLLLTVQGSQNYILAFKSNDFTIKPIILVVTPTANQGKVYGGIDPVTLTYTVTDLNGNDKGNLVSGKLDRKPGENAGRYEITIGSLTPNANHTIQLEKEYYTIAKAMLRVKAKDVTVCQGEELILGYEIESTDWVNGENESVLTSKPKVSGPSTGSKVPGVFDLEVHSASAINYDFIYTKGRLEVYRLPEPTIVKVSEGDPLIGSIVKLEANGDASSTYEWTWEGGSGVVTGTEVSIPVSQGKTRVSLTETNTNGCSATTTYLIKTQGGVKILIPNNFITPNGDGKNDVWVVSNLDHFTSHHLVIVDRSGRKVYESNNYQSDWGGISLSGETLGEGTYYYMLNVDGEMYKSFVTIIR